MRLRSHAACWASVSTFQLPCYPVEFIQRTLVEIPGSIVPLHAVREGVPTLHLESLLWYFENFDFFFFLFLHASPVVLVVRERVLSDEHLKV